MNSNVVLILSIFTPVMIGYIWFAVWDLKNHVPRYGNKHRCGKKKKKK